MKKNILIIASLITAPLFLRAQKTDYRVVFDVTSKDSMVHKAVIRWINEISVPNPDAKLEVVFYSQSLDMITKNKSAVAADVMRLAQNKNIIFRVCEMAMKSHHIEKADLIPGVGTVPDGIYELITRQREGWGYIKASQ